MRQISPTETEKFNRAGRAVPALLQRRRRGRESQPACLPACLLREEKRGGRAAARSVFCAINQPIHFHQEGKGREEGCERGGLGKKKERKRRKSGGACCGGGGGERAAKAPVPVLESGAPDPRSYWLREYLILHPAPPLNLFFSLLLCSEFLFFPGLFIFFIQARPLVLITETFCTELLFHCLFITLLLPAQLRDQTLGLI